MESIKIPYHKTGYFSNIMLDYLNQKEGIKPFYNRFPSIENFEAQIQEKSTSFKPSTRKVLVEALENQYKNIEASDFTISNIKNLVSPNTFTITTGHQLNLFSGPLYFLYKIISVINLCKQLKEKYPKNNFVPIYWMASEDHDFEEIQYFNLKGKKVLWDKDSGGPVGRLSTDGLNKVYQEFSSLLNSGKNADELRVLFENTYLNFDNLGDASRYLVNELFGKQGLVIIDGDDVKLKTLFKPYALKELKEQISYKEVSKTNVELESQSYNIQVNPREVNLFYIANGLRERIIKNENGYYVNNTEIRFSTEEDLFKNTDKLEFVSGNALLRPLYQEVILPNLCYVGGGGELAYWMQLKSTFKVFNVTFPVLLLRNSALIVSEKQKKKADKLNVKIEDLFLTQNKLINKKVKEQSEIDYDFKAKREQLEVTFLELEKLAFKTDKSFIGAVKAQEKKQLKGLDNLERRLLKAEKKKMYDLVTRIEVLQNQLFPNSSLQERQHNFSEYYESYGYNLIKKLFRELDPLNLSFTIVLE